MKLFLMVTLFLAAGAVLADPPMKVVYQKSSSTKFVWQWPYHTVRSTTYVYNTPALMGSGFKISPYYSYAVPGDVSQYRFHNSHLTYQNQWGYFFPPGTKPVKIGTVSVFQSPQGYFIQSR